MELSFGVIPVHKGEDGIYRYLVIEQKQGHWTFPKGHSEAGESEIEVAKRELKEETGIIDCHIDPKKTYVSEYSIDREGKVTPKRVTYYMGHVDNPAVTIDRKEVIDYKWVTLEEALRLITYESTKNLAKETVGQLP